MTPTCDVEMGLRMRGAELTQQGEKNLTQLGEASWVEPSLPKATGLKKP